MAGLFNLVTNKGFNMTNLKEILVSQRFGTNILEPTISWITEKRHCTCFLIIITIFIYVLRTRISKKCNKDVLKSDKCSISDVGQLGDIIQEIHYASSNCRMDPSLAPRCIFLLEIFPGACDIPLPNHNYTPFLRACWNGCYKLIQYMIQIGANIHATTSKGEGAIYLATYYIVKNKEKDFSILKILLVAGADINAARCDGYTALYLAAARGHSRVVRWLLVQGARPTLPGLPSARHLAAFYGHTKTAKLFYEINSNTH